MELIKHNLYTYVDATRKDAWLSEKGGAKTSPSLIWQQKLICLTFSKSREMFIFRIILFRILLSIIKKGSKY